MISICVPIHQTDKTAFFLSRLLRSLDEQTYRDFEVVITDEGAMAKNHNAALTKGKGELLKLMQMDDYFAHSSALQNVVDAFADGASWLISACVHTDESGEVFGPHSPEWTDNMVAGNNRLGSLSTLTVRSDKLLLLDEDLTWVVDCDLYQRYYDQYGHPFLLAEPNVVIDTGTHRLSSTLSPELKQKEIEILIKRYDTQTV